MTNKITSITFQFDGPEIPTDYHKLVQQANTALLMLFSNFHDLRIKRLVLRDDADNVIQELQSE